MADFQKQTVQWFPGHMAKTRRIIKESLNKVDGVVELVDARIPYSSSNPELDSIIKRKPRIVLLNKCDIAEPTATKMWIDYYKSKGIYALPVDCRTGKGLNNFIPTVNKALASVIKKNEERGMAGKSLRLMVVGIPNTGKSSFKNRMAGNANAKVADKAGVTRQQQWFNVGKGIELLDTPGVLWPKFDDPTVGIRLACTGAVKDTVMDIETLAVNFIDEMKKRYAHLLEQRYIFTLDKNQDSYDILCEIGRKRGMVIRGGEIDTERAAVMLMDEYRAGKLGKTTLDSANEKGDKSDA